MDDLPQLLEVNPELTSINLEFAEIESLEPLLPWLQQFTKLEELLLFGNRLESLPQNLSSLARVRHLDISNNIFTSLKHVLPGLASLPRLRSLNITLETPQDEQRVLEALPRLEQLNGAAPEAAASCGLTQEDLEAVASLYDQIRDKWREVDETAEALETSKRTVEREWTRAKAHLYRELHRED